jgi:hypothetical protein
MFRVRTMLLLIVFTGLLGLGISIGAIVRSGTPQATVDAHHKTLEQLN